MNARLRESRWFDLNALMSPPHLASAFDAMGALLPGLTRQSVFFKKWMHGSSPRMMVFLL
jgi:hypothetical protein